MTTQTYTHNGITLTQPMVKMLSTWWAIGNDGWLVVHHGITVGALVRRGLAEKVAVLGYRITDAGRAWLAAYEAEHRDAAARAEGYESAADKEREEARAEELDHDAAAEPRAYEPGPIVLGLVAHFLQKIKRIETFRHVTGFQTGALKMLREAVRVDAHEQGAVMTDAEVFAWVRGKVSES